MRDPSLILCDYPQNNDYSKRILKVATKLGPSTDTSIEIIGDLKVQTKRKNILYAIGCSFDIQDEKSERIINSLIEYFEAFYKGRTDALLQQNNLTPHVLDGPFKSSFERLFEGYNTIVSNTLVKEALGKADKTRTNLVVAVDKMLATNEETKELEDLSEETKDLSQEFLTNTKKLNKTMKDRNW